MKIYLFIILFFSGASQMWSQSDFSDAQELASQQSFESSSMVLIDYIGNNPQRRYDVARAWWLHSYNLLQQGLLEEALKANTTSLDLRKRLRSSDAAYNYLRQAEINMAANSFAIALGNALEGMDLMIEDALLYAELNMMCAKALNAMEQYEEAQTYIQTALDIIKIEVGKQHDSYSHTAFTAGFLSLSAHSFDEARHYFQQAYIHSSDTVLRTAAYFFSVVKY